MLKETHTKVNPEDKSFKIDNQEWLIIDKSDMSEYPNIRRVFDTNKIEARLIIRRPKGKKLYETPLFKSGYVYAARIIKV